MALITCGECGKNVSTKAVACPSCGAPPDEFVNGRRIPSAAIAGAVAIGIFIFIASTCASKTEEKKSESARPAAPAVAHLATKVTPGPTPEQIEAESQRCLADLQCAGEKLHIEAEVYCETMLEREARAVAKWDYKIEETGFFDRRFDRFRWADESKRQIIFVGDKAKFQNGFGAWQRISYNCSFDVETKKPRAVWFNGQPMPENAVSASPPETKPAAAAEGQVPNKETQAANAGPSFNCKRARSTVEKLICDDDELSTLDRELSDLLAQAKQEASDTKALMDATRVAWNWREKNCRDKECLLTWYADRKGVYTAALREHQ